MEPQPRRFSQDRSPFEAELDKIDQKHENFFKNNPSGLPEQDCIRNYIIEGFNMNGDAKSGIITKNIRSLPTEIQEDFFQVLGKYFPDVSEERWYRHS